MSGRIANNIINNEPHLAISIYIHNLHSPFPMKLSWIETLFFEIDYYTTAGLSYETAQTILIGSVILDASLHCNKHVSLPLLLLLLMLISL